MKDQVWESLSNGKLKRYMYWVEDCIIIDIIETETYYSASIRSPKDGSLSDIKEKNLRHYFGNYTDSKIVNKGCNEIIEILSFQYLVKAKMNGWPIKTLNIFSKEL